MSTQQKNRLKAILLLVVFSMNTLAGFACSIGFDMGYNRHHHTHAKAHIQKKCPGHQKHSLTHRTTATSFRNMSNDDCCSNAVTKFNLSDKVIVHKIQLQSPSFPITYISAFDIRTEDPTAANINSLFQFVRRSCSINHTDIRIAIQSFQI